jgi:hypothetical protein
MQLLACSWPLLRWTNVTMQDIGGNDIQKPEIRKTSAFMA